MNETISYCEKTKVISTPEDEFEVPHRGGIGCALYQEMKANSEKIAQIDGVTGETDTYSLLLSRCIKTATYMSKNGIKRNDVISMCSYNHFNTTVPFVASFFIGAKIASLDPSMSLSELSHLIKMVEPKILFASEECESLMEAAILDSKCEVSLVIFGESKRNRKFSDILKLDLDNDFQPEVCGSLTDVAMIIFSSGTTGMPKGICVSHLMLFSGTKHKSGGITLSFATFYWISTISITLITFLSGATKIVCPPFNPKLAWEILGKYKVNGVMFSSYDLGQLYKNRPSDIIENSSLKALYIGGGHFSYENIKKVRALFPNTFIILSYAQTELLPIVNSMHPLVFSKPNCVGMPMKGRNYKVVDPDTEKPLGFHQNGEIRIKTNFCMSGYHNQDSSDAWDSDGFLKTGDIGYYDEDFCFYIIDRIKEVFKYKSFHIVPAKIEKILSDHPDVKLAVVVGIPHPEDDNHALAVIEIYENSKVTPDEIKKFLEERVDDRHKLRAGVKFIKDMPLSPSGKVKRRQVRDMFIGKS